MASNRLYDAMPVLVQNLGCTWAGYQRTRARFSNHFYKVLSEWRKTESLPQEELQKIQKRRLLRLIDLARESVAYYRGLETPVDSSDPSEAIAQTLASVPVLDKDDYRSNFESIINPAIPLSQIRQSRTRGTTGTALRLAHSPEAIAEEYATCLLYTSPSPRDRG